MDKEYYFQDVMNKTLIVRPPRHTLATFGTTVFQYVFLSPLPDSETQCRRREGRVTAQRPQILTPDIWAKRFEGFGEETELYKKAIDRLFGEAFRGLEYTFKNELDTTTLETTPLNELTDRVLSVMEQENAPRTTLLQGPDATWGLGVMKFIVEMSLRSLPVNLRELDEHDSFDPQQRHVAKTRRQIELLFKEALVNPAAIKKLGETLKETGHFPDYEDRFFALFRNR